MTGLMPGSQIVGEMVRRRLAEYPAPEVGQTDLVAHEARKCARAVSFRLFKVPKDLPLTDEEYATFRKGDFYHAICQEVLATYKFARLEVPFQLAAAPIGGKVDALYEAHIESDYELLTRSQFDEHKQGGPTVDIRVVVEVKSTGAKGFDAATGEFSFPAGPKVEWLTQGGLGCLGLGADYLHVILVDTETRLLDKQTGELEHRVAEWLINTADPLPHLDMADEHGDPCIQDLAEAEVKRLVAIHIGFKRGEVARRVIPGHGLVEEPPPAGSRVDPFNCRFCAWQPTCAQLPSEAVEISRVRSIKENAA